jgi:AcrR family transcriptional regulator
VSADATLYRHFPDRQALMRQVALDVLGRVAREAHAALAEEPDSLQALAGVRALAWSGDEPGHGKRHCRRGPEPTEAARAQQHQPGQPVRVGDREAGGDGRAERDPHQRWRRRAGALDQPTEPGEHAVGVQRAVGHLRGAQARQVGRDHAMGPHQVGDEWQPHP